MHKTKRLNTNIKLHSDQYCPVEKVRKGSRWLIISRMCLCSNWILNRKIWRVRSTDKTPIQRPNKLFWHLHQSQIMCDLSFREPQYSSYVKVDIICLNIWRVFLVRYRKFHCWFIGFETLSLRWWSANENDVFHWELMERYKDTRNEAT